MLYMDLKEFCEVLRKALNLEKVPHYSTICKAVKRLREEDLKKVLEESSKLLDVKLDILAIDSTASFYYAKIRKKRKNWTKLMVVVDVKSQAILAGDIRNRPGNDGVI